MVCIFFQNNWVCEDDDMPNYVEMVFWCGNIAGFLLWGYTNDRYASLMIEKKIAGGSLDYSSKSKLVIELLCNP